MKRFFILLMLFSVVLFSADSALATNGYQLIGVGQIQKSMGGAVTAAPLDSMTAITNPAGMSRIGNRADFSIEAFMPTRSEDFDETGGESTEGGSDLYGVPAIGWTAPAFGREDVYFGGGMYGTSGLGVDYDEITYLPGSALDFATGQPAGTFEDVTFSGYSSIQFWKMAPTVAWNINEKTSVGFALNLDYQSLSITERFRNVPFYTNPADPTAGITQRDITFDIGRPTSQMGFGATMGVLYDINQWVTVGASYATEQSFEDAEFRAGTNDILNFGGATGEAGTYRMDLDYPQQLATGVAVKPIEKLLIAFDIKWIDWSGTHDSVSFSGPSNSFDTDGDGIGDSSSTELEFGWEDQWVYALGFQYDATEKLTLRTGFNYSKAPIDEEDVFNNIVLPAIVERHYGLGFDYQLGAHWAVGATYMKAFEETLEGSGDISSDLQSVTPFGEDSDAVISLEEDSIGIQLSYLF